MNDTGLTPLQVAAALGYTEMVRLLLDYNADMDIELFVQGDTGYIPCKDLRIAVGREDADIVELLLQHGARIDERTLEEGVFKANETIFQALLDHGADLSHRYAHERTILHTATAKGAPGILNELINKKAEIDARDTQGSTPLHLAAAYNHETIVQLLLDAGANIEAVDNQNSTALAIAIKAKATAVIRTVLDNNVNMKAYDEAPPALILAAIEKDESSVRILLERGADANVHFHTLVRPLHLAAAYDQPALLELLLSYGAHVDPRITCHELPDQSCQTPLHFAVNYGHVSAAKVLLKWGADVNGRYHDGMTPLHLAAQTGQLDMASFLLVHGAGITAETEKTDTPFSMAIARGHSKIAEMLLRNGHAVMAASQKARGLVMAVTNGSTSLVAALLDLGIPVKAIDGQGRTALSVAKSMSNKQLVNFLISRGAGKSTRDNAAPPGRPIGAAGSQGHSKGLGRFRLFQQKFCAGRG
jgi:ankyrin repeat protein